MKQEIQAFDWNRMFMGDYPAAFLLEVLLRGFIIFLVVLLALRITGKRGVKQLSLFELVFILTLGSAGGDVIFYEDVPIIPVITTFVAIIGFYLITVYLTSHNEKFGKWMEGEPRYIIENGKFILKYLEEESFSHDEICMELRGKSIEHIGQVKSAILEPSGNLSVFYYSDDEVKPGMPTPPALRKLYDKTENEGFYSCARCGNTQKMPADDGFICDVCNFKRCMKSLSCKRLV